MSEISASIKKADIMINFDSHKDKVCLFNSLTGSVDSSRETDRMNKITVHTHPRIRYARVSGLVSGAGLSEQSKSTHKLGQEGKV